jgi:hypothetical protein
MQMAIRAKVLVLKFMGRPALSANQSAPCCNSAKAIKATERAAKNPTKKWSFLGIMTEYTFRFFYLTIPLTWCCLLHVFLALDQKHPITVRVFHLVSIVVAKPIQLAVSGGVLIGEVAKLKPTVD